jgi:hypothetical protein
VETISSGAYATPFALQDVTTRAVQAWRQSSFGSRGFPGGTRCLEGITAIWRHQMPGGDHGHRACNPTRLDRKIRWGHVAMRGPWPGKQGRDNEHNAHSLARSLAAISKGAVDKQARKRTGAKIRPQRRRVDGSRRRQGSATAGGWHSHPHPPRRNGQCGCYGAETGASCRRRFVMSSGERECALHTGLSKPTSRKCSRRPPRSQRPAYPANGTQPPNPQP